MFDKPCTVYLACPMTGWDKKDIVRLAKYAVDLAAKYGLKAWSPVLHEKISGKGKLGNNKADLDWKWPMDKEALNNSFVFVNMRADEKSFGCEDEYGRHRYSEWQPCIRISLKHRNGYVSIANYQTDYIAESLSDAFYFIARNWGKWHQRFIWKMKLWNHSLLPWMERQLKRMVQ